LSASTKVLAELGAFCFGLALFCLGLYSTVVGQNPLGGRSPGWVLILMSAWFLVPAFLLRKGLFRRLHELELKKRESPPEAADLHWTDHIHFRAFSAVVWVVIILGLVWTYSTTL
jgi:hypothetical protein